MSALDIAISQWIAREHGDEIALATLAQIELRSGERALTLLEDRVALANRTFANLSAYDLALWFAVNWWRLRWEPFRDGADWRMAHSMTTVGGGYVWPSITMISDGEHIQLQVRPTAGMDWEPIRYLESIDRIVPAGDFELAIDSFVESVLARLFGRNLSSTELHELWEELIAERRNPSSASLRKLEALLGFDAGIAPDDVIDSLFSAAEAYGRSAIDEIAAGVGGGAPQVIETIVEDLDRNGTDLSCDHIRDLASHQTEWNFTGEPWERATEAARIARTIWKLDGSPVPNSALTRIAGTTKNFISSRAVFCDSPIAAGKWTTRSRDSWRVILKSRWPVNRRFELCRLIADGLVASEGDLLLPATASRTSRQKFQRAFAQEFLCPFDVLRERLGPSAPTDEDIEDAAAHFEVSPLVIRTTLVNKGILPRDLLSANSEVELAPTGTWK